MDFISVLQKFLNPLGWLASLGEKDTEHMRDELEDLLHHTAASLKSFVQLREALEEIPHAAFSRETFGKVYFYCTANFTSPFAASKARTHCTDIVRDTNRIGFRAAKYLRTEGGDWKGLSGAFAELKDADAMFLDDFEKLVAEVDQELRAIYELLGSKVDTTKRDEAWRRYEALRSKLQGQYEGLKETLTQLGKAEVNVRRLLT